jgi:hypothetical protein
MNDFPPYIPPENLRRLDTFGKIIKYSMRSQEATGKCRGASPPPLACPRYRNIKQ